MATYKVIQDIEAEDKILGPLTLRQFIFALIAAFLFYICFILTVKHAAFLLVIFLPPALFFAFFAMPFGRDQPTEVWALAKLRYWFKPRSRVWNQSGVKELVTITAPKKVERIYTNGLSEGEVTSRLRALADTIDSRGWAVKNVKLNAYSPPIMVPAGSDRLLDASSMPQPVLDNDVQAADDILDPQSNPIAQQFDSMINQSVQAHRQQLVDQLNSSGGPQPSAEQNNYWFMGNGQAPASQQTPIQTAPQAAQIDPAEEAALSSQLKSKHAAPAPYSNLRTMKPLVSAPKTPVKAAPKTAAPPVTAPADPAILSLADNNDLNVATLAREAKRAKGEETNSGPEVVVPLR
jgi:hypothetical protein